MHAASEQDPVVTRERLLESAGEVFAEHGFRGATIRDICKRAGANVAAVSYHFGDKEKLYAAAVRYAHSCSAGNVLDAAGSSEIEPRKRLLGFVRAMLTGIIAAGKPAWHSKLMAREMAEPTAVLQQIADEGIKPRLRVLGEIIRAVAGPDIPDAAVFRCARSIVGQVLFYHFARPMLTRVFPDERFDTSNIETLTEHIVTFSLGGVRGIAAAGEDGD